VTENGETLTVQELAERLLDYAAKNPGAKVWAHWEGWVMAPINPTDLWSLPDGGLAIDCNDKYDKLTTTADATRILGGVEVTRVLQRQ
jgi:hypothetical protein